MYILKEGDYVKKQRIDSLDFVRGICIIYMIMGHIAYKPIIDHYIHAFHMPLFFVVSGFFLINTNMTIKEYFIKMIKKVLIPYFIWSSIFLIIAYKTSIGLIDTPVNVFINNIITNNNAYMPIAGALWFLTSFFFANLLYFILNKKITSNFLLTFICFFIMAFGILFFKYTNINLWWSIESSLVGVGLMHIGNLIKKYELLNKLENIKINFKYIVTFLILLILHYTLIMNVSYVNMRISTYPHIVLFILNVLQSLVIYVMLYKILSTIRIFNILVKCIEYLGINSMIPLCLNQFCIYAVSLIITKLGIDIFPNYYIKSFIMVVFIYIITKICMNTKLKILFGKR